MLSSKKFIALTVCLYLLVGSAWIMGTDYLLERSLFDFPTTTGWQTLRNLSFVLGTAIFFYLALRSTAAKVTVARTLARHIDLEDLSLQEGLRAKRLRLRVPIGIFLLLLLILAVAGMTFYRQVSATMRRNAWTDLRNVAGLKARQVAIWRLERAGDAATITKDSDFLAALQSWLLRKDIQTTASERIIRRMKAVQQGYQYQSVMIFDGGGNQRFSTFGGTDTPPDAALMQKALQGGRPVFSAFHTTMAGRTQVIDFFVPLSVTPRVAHTGFGVLVLRVAGENKLYPVLHWWPGGTQSAETLLVQNASTGVPTLVSFQPNETMKITHSAFGAGAGIQSFLQQANRAGLYETLDPQGVPVLVAVEAVPASDWMLITKVDREEVYRPLRRLSGASGAVVLFLVVASALGISLWWRQQMAGFTIAFLQNQLHRQALRKHLKYLTQFANDIILLIDDQACIVEANDRAVATYGYSLQELLGMNIRQLRDPETLSDFEGRWQKAYDEGIIFETRHCCADGHSFPVEVSARRVEVEGEVWCQSIVRNITERKHQEQKIQRLTRLYNVLSRTNQAIVHHRDRQALFEDVCRIAVDLGSLRMAVIVATDLAAEKLTPLAAFGAEQSFLDSINFHTLQGPEGRGPTLQVVRDRRPYLCNDVLADSSLKNRVEAASLFRFQSVALFPLIIGDNVFGTLNLYAAEKDFFEPDMVTVLDEMASDITFALNNFEKETVRKKTEERLVATTSTLTALYQATPLPVMIIDLDGRVTFWNPAAEQTFGWTGQGGAVRPLPLVAADRKEEFVCNMDRIKNGEHLRGVEVHCQRQDGSLLDMLLFSAPLYSAQGQMNNIVALLMDTTEQKRAREHIVCLAHYDQLTGLANRTLLRERFAQEVSRARREERFLALCLIDLDKFKSINDALGHILGDKLLIQVARRLEQNLRGADVICRPGGDEFLLLLTDFESPQSSGVIAPKILNTLQEPFSLDGHTVSITASIGISIFPEDGEDLDTLFRNADTAMYAAKERGRNNFMFFQSEMDQRIRNRLNLENSLREALNEQAFFLHYQPQVDIASGRITGAEALLRFRHPVQGLISPDKLIPIAEDSGLIVPMGEWILEEACCQLSLWRDKGLVDLTMAVNLSAVQVFQENFAMRAKDILEAHKINPKHLYFELTESIFIEEDDRVRQTLLALKKLGVGISLDDFGTGYSSLNYLKRYAVDEIKIDRTFVQDVCSDPGDAAIVQATIQMAHSLGLTTVAEGVETFEQLAFLSKQQCDRYQGYLCSQPVAPEDFFALVQAF